MASSKDATNNIKVVCRFRPPNALELREAGNASVVQIDDTGTTVKLKSQEGTKGPEANGFTFDRAFDIGTQQEEVFEYGVRSIVDDVINGYNGTVFAYGQTGSGKTFTMMGADIDNPSLRGLIPRITEQIFQSIMSSPANLEYLVKVSYMEIYMERIRDLLAPQNDNLQVHEEKQRGVYIKGLSDFYVGSAAEVYEIMRQGGSARVTSSTNMNAESSRSHSIFVITISQRNLETGSQKNGNLYLVDLAGSEKVGKTGASGQTLEEAKKINKSLSALGMVINALTDGKSTHIPYRDSKLTRILQESLGGNSRTTLIINCSPSLYNEPETLSTLRFGMRAKSIKNKARINAELSPAELKVLLKKAQKDVANSTSYIALLEAELSTWRSGGKVDSANFASSEKAISHPPPPATPSRQDSPSIPSRPFTPMNPALESLRDDTSRPETPSSASLEKDEREEFLARENELSDQLAEKELAFAANEKIVQELREELKVYTEQESTLSKDNKSLSTEVNEMRLQLERIQYDSKESTITLDAVREQNAELTTEIEDLRRTINEIKLSQKGFSQDSKEKKKAEKLAALMGNFQGSAVTEKEEQIRSTLDKLDEALDSSRPLSVEDITVLRKQLKDSQTQVSEQNDRLRQTAEESEALTRRRDELEARLSTLEQDYEELLGQTISNEDDLDLSAEPMRNLKAQLEAQFALKRDANVRETNELKAQLENKEKETKELQASIESMKGANEELKRAFAITAAGIEGGKNLAESAKDMERIRRTMATQLEDFDLMKKALMKDLQERCERVVELEISLDETKEQYATVVKASNTKAQDKKMAFLTRNLDQLVGIQKQLVEQNAALKKDVSLAERKLLARNERIQGLEVLLQDAQAKMDNQNTRFNGQMEEVRKRLAEAKAAEGNRANGGLLSSFGRLAKPIRGQGDVALPQAPTPVKSSTKSSWFYA